MEMFSEALRIMDRNSERAMVRDLEDEVREIGEQLKEKDKSLKEKDKKIEELQRKIALSEAEKEIK